MFFLQRALAAHASARARAMSLRQAAHEQSRQLPYEKGGGVAPGWFVVRIDFSLKERNFWHATDRLKQIVGVPINAPFLQ